MKKYLRKNLGQKEDFENSEKIKPASLYESLDKLNPLFKSEMMRLDLSSSECDISAIRINSVSANNNHSIF